MAISHEAEIDHHDMITPPSYRQLERLNFSTRETTHGNFLPHKIGIKYPESLLIIYDMELQGEANGKNSRTYWICSVVVGL